MWLVRHGETEWSRDHKHTSTTDLPLTDVGEEMARALPAKLAGVDFDLVLTSPRQRARRTAELAGFPDAEVDEDLVEWAYGDYEGVTTDGDPGDGAGLVRVVAPDPGRRDRRGGRRAAGPGGGAGAGDGGAGAGVRARPRAAGAARPAGSSSRRTRVGSSASTPPRCPCSATSGTPPCLLRWNS